MRHAASNRYTTPLNTFAKIVSICGAILLAACGASKQAPVQDLTGRQDLSLFAMHSIAGTRDGDRLQTQAIFSDTSSILTVEMHFAIGSPTTLESGTWKWPRGGQLLSGTVASRSVTFLGGQDGPPSIGGTFDLPGSDGGALYRVTVPLTQLKVKILENSKERLSERRRVKRFQPRHRGHNQPVEGRDLRFGLGLLS